MRIPTVAGALAISGAVVLSAPAGLEAAHRHSRSCGHDRGYSSRSYRPYSYRPYSYRPYPVPYPVPYPAPYAYSPYVYVPPAYSAYGYDPYYYDRYYPPPRRGHHHGRRFCVRPHLSIHIGF